MSCKFEVVNRRIIYDSEIAHHRIEGWSTSGALSFPKRHGISYHESKVREKSKCELTANTWPGVDIRVVVVIISGVARLTQGSQQNIIYFLVGLEANKVATGCVAGSVRCPSGCRNVHHRVPTLLHISITIWKRTSDISRLPRQVEFSSFKVGAGTWFQSVKNLRGSSAVFCNSRSEFSWNGGGCRGKSTPDFTKSTR